MTRAEIRTLIQSWLDDINGGYFTSSQVNTWINLAQRQVQMSLLLAGQNWYEKAVETPLVYGQNDYMLPDDFMVEHRLEVVISGTGAQENRQILVQVTNNQADLVGLNYGIPTNYIIKKDRFTVLPTPNQALTMRLYYSPIVADLTQDSDVPDVPEQFMEYLAVLAAYDGFIKDDRTPENLMAKKVKYEEMLNKMAAERMQDMSRQVVLTQPYDYGAFF